MSWFNASQLSSFAKQALTQAQKSIDRVLDIQEEEPTAWAETIPYGEQGKGFPTSRGWDTSAWGLNSNPEPQSQPVASPKAITKPVRRILLDESENFFSAFLSPADVQQSSVVSKPPTKSQRPKEEVKSNLHESPHSVQPETCETTVTAVKDSSLQESGEVKKSAVPLKKLEEAIPRLKTEMVLEENISEGADIKVSSLTLEVPEGVVGVKSSGKRGLGSPTESLMPESKNVGVEGKEQKPEDRQSNTPSPPISTFSSGTSTTSDIEVLDHESVISESSASSRQEAADSKSSLHLMQTSFQLLSASACPEYNRLDDFQKLTESCCSSDAFERIDSFSVQSLDSRSVSEINSDDEMSGKGYALVPIPVSSSTPRTETAESMGRKSEAEVSETLIIPPEEAEMEESGRSATPVNSEQPDVLVVTPPINEDSAVVEEDPVPCRDDESQPEVLFEKEDLCKTIDVLNEKLEKRETQLLAVSKEKAFLEEAYDNLKDEMFRVKEESSSISSLKDEFTQRIAEAEKKVQVACKERDAAKKEVKTIKEELAMRLNCNETAELLKEKDEQIQGLMEEGEKLSKQQLHNSNIIKKLRAKEKENENINAKQSKKKRELEEELQHLKQVGDLRLALQRTEQAAARKEDYLRHEISELQQRLQEAENRNQELGQSVTSATRPLLRQIENLQATLGTQTASWEKLEKNLSDRLGESQTLLAAAVERERAAVEELLSNKIQVSSTESQNSLLRQENSRFQAQLEAEKNKFQKLKDENNRCQVELENLKDEYFNALEETRKEKVLLNSQLEMEKMKVEQERKKAFFAQEMVKEKERKPFPFSTMESVSSTPTLSRSSSISGVDMSGLQASVLSQDEVHDHSLGPMCMSANGSNLYDAIRMGAGSSIIENLQSQLKLKEGEIIHLQLEIGNLEKTRSIMAEELVKLTNQNDELEEKVKEIPKLRAQLRDLDQRYNTILQMYGEKAEEAEELRLDLEDVKNMYKTQIDELLKQRPN
uniref:TATA element modulatory factor 1 n=1 Tax=Ornithorhynchus anatinus TaxID=9258 RepID=A0A6I8PR06_ORNAN